jgi:hypothetical protein
MQNLNTIFKLLNMGIIIISNIIKHIIIYKIIAQIIHASILMSGEKNYI